MKWHEVARVLLRRLRLQFRQTKQVRPMNSTITQPVAPQQQHIAAPPEAMALLWSRVSWLKEAWDFVQTVMAWPGVTVAVERDGLCMALNGVRLGRLRWSWRIDLPFRREMADRLVVEQMVTRDPENPDTHCVVFDIRTPADVDRAVWLFRLAYLSADSRGQRACN